MSTFRIATFGVVVSVLIMQSASSASGNPQSNRNRSGSASDTVSTAEAQKKSEGRKPGNQAEELANKLRRAIPTLPALVRGSDSLLNVEGQRATQNQLVTSSNVKDPAIDSVPLSGSLPVEAAEPVQTPGEQFTVTLPKFYATVPVVDRVSTGDWRFRVATPEFALRHGPDGMRGIRSATPGISATGPFHGGKLVMFQSFEYRLSKTSVENLFREQADVRFESYDWNTHFDIKATRRNTVTTRLALFSQRVDLAGLGGSMAVEAAPNYFMGGGQLSASDTYASSRGSILSSYVSLRKLQLRVLPQGDEPMQFIEQGEMLGNYFDSLHRSSSRAEWREALRLPDMNGLGTHQLGLGIGLARSWFESSHFSRTIILRGHDDDELSSITNFAGSPFESTTMNETTLWGEDKWAPSSRASFRFGVKYDRTSISRTNEWAPRVGFSLLPFKRTVIRGGIGLFYDILPLTAGTFTEGRQRVVQFFDESVPIGQPRVLKNVTSRRNLRTSNVLGWNFEIDREVSGNLVVRAKAEERRGRNILLVHPDASPPHTTALILSDDGKSRYRELETTASYRPVRSSVLNFSYIRSSGDGDLNAFSSVFGTFEKPFIGANRHARLRTDSPNRFLAWGDVTGPWGIRMSPALDVHTGFPFSFTDASNHVAPEADFGRYPRSVSLDLEVHHDFEVSELGRNGRLRLGLRVFNITNHFNPRGVDLDEDEEEKNPVLRGFFDNPGRTYRASLLLNF